MYTVISPPLISLTPRREMPRQSDASGEVTSRDAYMVHLVWTHRVLRTDHLIAVTQTNPKPYVINEKEWKGGSYRKLRERLSFLKDRGVLREVADPRGSYVKGHRRHRAPFNGVADKSVAVEIGTM